MDKMACSQLESKCLCNFDHCFIDLLVETCLFVVFCLALAATSSTKKQERLCDRLEGVGFLIWYLSYVLWMLL